MKFRRQYSVDSYVLDFYAPTCKLAVEVDGDSHFTDGGVAYDLQRSRHLEQFGIAVVRFTNDDVDNHIESVIESIHAAVTRRAST